MLIGYARVSKTDGSQSLDLQRDALRAAGVDDAVNVYHDCASGLRDDRPGLDSCLRALRKGDVLVVWKLDRLGRNLAHLVNTVQDLSARGVGLRVLAGDRAQIDTTTAAGRLVFGIFAALAEFERELIRERTVAGLKAARARGRKDGRKFALSKAQVRLAQAAMAHRDTSVSALCRELGIRPVTLYRYVGPQGELREQVPEGARILKPEDRDAGRAAKRSILLPLPQTTRRSTGNALFAGRGVKSTTGAVAVGEGGAVPGGFRRCRCLVPPSPTSTLATLLATRIALITQVS